MQPHITLDDQTRAFLGLLWRGGKWAYFWTADESKTYHTHEGSEESLKRSYWFPIGKIPNPPKEPTAHLYFSVNPSTEKRSSVQRAVMASVASIGALFAEYDVKDWQSKEAILNFVATLPRKPSVLIDSGGGYHAYWLLDEPFVIQSDEDRQRAKDISRRWVRFCEGDDVKDLTRVLRLPGSRNIKPKYAPDYPLVEYVYCNLDVRYSLADLVSILPEDRDEERASVAPRSDMRQRAALNGQGSIIDLYNANVSVESRLEAAGYSRRGKRYSAPNADKSTNSSVVILPGIGDEQPCSYHWDTGDVLADEHKHSAFDVYCHFEHGGNAKNAVKAYMRDIGKILEPEYIATGVACCPIHHTPLPKASNGNGYKCHEKDSGGWCDFYWKGDGYVMPTDDEKPKKEKHINEHTTIEGRNEPLEFVGDWRSGGITARQLQGVDFPPLRFIVQDILPEGCTLLAGKPKSKKSWLALGIGEAVACGGKALGKLDVIQGRVLYLDLESNQRRMQSRLRATLGDRSAWPDNFHVFTEWPRGDEGIRQLDQWMIAYPDTNLVIADILQNIRPARVKNANPYDEDYEAVKPLNMFAERHRIALIVIHHTRKAKADDVFDEISGSTGLSGGVANMWVVGRVPTTTDSILAIRGRDVTQDDDTALGWDEYLCQHILTGDAAQYAVGKERKAILDAMELGRAYQPKEIAGILGKAVGTVNKLLLALCDAGAVVKPGEYGKYEKVVPSGKSGKSIPSGKSGVSYAHPLQERTDNAQLGTTLTDSYHARSESDQHSSASNSPTLTTRTTLTTIPQKKSGFRPMAGYDEQAQSESTFEIDCALVNGVETWRLWDGVNNRLISQHPTEAAALASVPR